MTPAVLVFPVRRLGRDEAEVVMSHEHVTSLYYHGSSDHFVLSCHFIFEAVSSSEVAIFDEERKRIIFILYNESIRPALLKQWIISHTHQIPFTSTFEYRFCAPPQLLRGLTPSRRRILGQETNMYIVTTFAQSWISESPMNEQPESNRIFILGFFRDF